MQYTPDDIINFVDRFGEQAVRNNIEAMFKMVENEAMFSHVDQDREYVMRIVDEMGIEDCPTLQEVIAKSIRYLSIAAVYVIEQDAPISRLYDAACAACYALNIAIRDDHLSREGYNDDLQCEIVGIEIHSMFDAVALLLDVEACPNLVGGATKLAESVLPTVKVVLIRSPGGLSKDMLVKIDGGWGLDEIPESKRHTVDLNDALNIFLKD